jgi:hypothetical protein
MSSISEFRGALLGGGARPNQFRVELTFPGFVSGGSAAGRAAQFLCDAASLPGSYVGVARAFYKGREVKLAGERVFQNWQIRIINDNDFKIHDAFEDWSNKINGVRDNNGLTNPNTYTANMTVHQLDRNGVTVKSYTFVDCWPTQITDIQLDFGRNDEIENFTVDLAYSYWEASASSGGIAASVGINTPIGGVGISV